MYLCAQSCLTLCDPMDCSPPGSSVQEYWNGLPFPSPGDLLDLGIKPTSPVSPVLADGFFYYCTTMEYRTCKSYLYSL